MLPLLLALTASAQELPIGAIELQTTTGATVEVFPRVDPQTIEMVVYDNQKPLDLQLDAQRTEHIVDAWAMTVGSGTWFVTLYVTSPQIEARVAKEDGGFVVSTRELGRPVSLESAPVPTVDALLADEVPRRPARPPRMPLRPLQGDAWMPRLDPRIVRLPFEPWTPSIKGLGEEASLSRIDRLRKRLVQTEDPWSRAVLMQHLALDHQALGLHREARTYFDEVGRQRVDTPTATVRLHQADAALATGRWESARSRCQEAHRAGAEASATLACIGSVALATGSPAPTPTARALLAADDSQEARLIAAQLLVVDNRFDEALPLLRDGDWPAELQSWRNATLGDAALSLGDAETAREAWRDVDTRGELGEIARQRARLVRLSSQPPSTWAEALPGLARDIDKGGETAAEAHYLAAQIGRTYDETGLAAEHLTALLDHFPERSARSDVPQRLLSVCTRRLAQLHRVERFADEAAFYDDCWREPLNAILLDPTALSDVAVAYEILGLWDPALSVQRDVVAALTRDDREDVEELVQLARLYVRVDRTREALETVAYAERVRGAAASQPALDVVAGEAHLALGELEPALKRWKRASTDPRWGGEARIRRALALAEAGRCPEAVPILSERESPPGGRIPSPVSLEEGQLAIARCLLIEQEPERALALSTGIVEAEPGSEWAGQARWLASLSLADDPDLPLPEGPAAPEGVWAAVIAETRETASVEDRIRALRP